MFNDDPVQVVFLAAALILPLSALAAYKLSWKKGVFMALVWASIFGGVTMIFSLVMG